MYTDQTKSGHRNHSDNANFFQNADHRSVYHRGSPKKDTPTDKDTKKTNGDTDINDKEITERKGPVRQKNKISTFLKFIFHYLFISILTIA